MKSLHKCKFVLASLLTLSSFSFAQSTLKGVVSDTLSQESLVGANVFLVGTSLGSACDIEGEYRISNIPDGKYSARISYIGYKTKIVEITFRNKQVIEMSFQLNSEAIEGKTITVSAQALGQAAAINQQITSNTIINVISEQKIQELPDANAAEAIGRLPGVALQRSGGEANKVILRGMSAKFSSITVDGVRMAPTDENSRGVDLSTVSQGSLAGIELYKALTPDKDADAIAGSVNLVTKKAPSHRQLRVDTRGAYNRLNKSFEQYDFQLRYGERFFDNLLGVQVNGSLEQRDRSNERTNLDYDTNLKDATDYQITNFSLSYNDEVRKRTGFTVILDFETPDGGTIKFNNILNKTNRDYITYGRNFPVGSAQLFYNARDREQNIQTFNSALTGENYLLDFKVNWALSFSQSNADFPFDYEMNFTEPSVTDAAGNPISKMKNIPKELVKGPAEQLIPYALNNFQQAFLYTAFYREQKNLDKEKAVQLNLSREYNFLNIAKGEIKFGGKYRSKSRFKESSELLSPYYLERLRAYQKLADGSVVNKNFDGTRFSQLLKNHSGPVEIPYYLDATPVKRDLYDKYLLYPLVNRDALRLWWDLSKNGVGNLNGSDPEYSRNFEADAYYYDIVERVSAGYIMNTLSFGEDITFIAGLRVESEDNDYRSRYSPDGLSGFPTPKGALKDTTAVTKETVWLPNFHFTFRPTDFMSLRLAAYKALARPDFNHRLQSFVARSNGTFYSGNSLYVGNPNLKAAKAWNFEINTSFYGNDIGLFSVSVFYKEVEDMYHEMNGIKVVGQKSLDSLGIPWKEPFRGLDFGLTYPYNSSSPTKVWGFEVEQQTNLRFLPGLLSNLVVSYNFSYVKSETYVISSKLVKYKETLPGFPFPIEKSKTVMYDEKQKLEGQPEFFGNFSIGYDIDGFSGRLSVFYQSEYNRIFSPDGRNDQVIDSYTRWDLAFKQVVTNNISLMFNLNNFTNIAESTSIKNRQMGWNLENTSENYGFNADLGLRVTL